MHVIVIGGGLAGLGAAVALSKSRPANVPVEITLVDPKEYFEIRWAAVRAFSNTKVRKDMQCEYGPILGKHSITHAQARVSALSKSAVILDSGELLKFDVCLIAVGAACPTAGVDAIPTEMSARRAQLAAAGEALLGKDVLVVGGGTLGSEVAGELAHANDGGNSISLVHSGDAMCQEMRPGGRRLVLRKLLGAGVDVVLNRRAAQRDDGKWIPVPKGGGGDTKEEEPFKAEEIVVCTGYKPANEFIKKGDLAKCLDERGWIRIDEQFRVEGCEGRIFGFGDCCDRGKKTAAFIMSNIQVVAGNIRTTLECVANGQGPTEVKQVGLKSMKEALNLTVLTLGPTDGVADTPIGAFSSILPALKNKTLFIGRGKGFVGGN